MRAVLLADTHIRPGRTRALGAGVYRQLERADVIFHAGDIVVGEVLEDLSRFAPVHAVLGNNDDGLELPVKCSLDVAGVRVGMIHDSGPRAGRPRRLARWFPDARLVVFGHSHIPVIDEHDGRLLFNPGSPTDKRRQPHHTLGLVELSDGVIEKPRLLVLDP